MTLLFVRIHLLGAEIATKGHWWRVKERGVYMPDLFAKSGTLYSLCIKASGLLRSMDGFSKGYL
jgi:hypothetical protein